MSECTPEHLCEYCNTSDAHLDDFEEWESQLDYDDYWAEREDEHFGDEKHDYLQGYWDTLNKQFEHEDMIKFGAENVDELGEKIMDKLAQLFVEDDTKDELQLFARML
jgi:hypothetical protein